MAEQPLLRVPSDRELSLMVRKAIYEGCSLDELVEAYLFRGEPSPLLWGQWPPRARETWDRAVEIWSREHPGLYLPGREMNPRRSGSGDIGEREASWKAVLSLGEDTWPDLPNVTWAHLAAKLGLGPRAVIHHYRMLLWAFDGRQASRRVLRAPCTSCGKPWSVARVVRRRGPCCQPAR